MSEARRGEDHGRGGHGEPKWWLDDPRNVNKIVWVLYAACALLLLIDPFVEKHGFAINHYFGFYAFYGMAAYVSLVLLAKQLRKILMRPENYYDE